MCIYEDIFEVLNSANQICFEWEPVYCNVAAKAFGAYS